MQDRRNRIRLLSVVLVLTIGSMSAFAERSTSPLGDYLFGVVPQFSATGILSVWRPVLDALEEETGLRFRLSGSDSIPAFEKEFSSGKFDFVYMNPYHFVHAERSQGYRPLVRDTGRELFGLIVVHKDSNISSIDQLQGAEVAFPAPNALGASLMPRAELVKRQIDIQPRYVRSHSSVYLNVALGKMAAGGGVQKTLEQQPQAVRNELRVIFRTPSFVPHPIAVHPRVSKALQERVKTALLSLGETDAGRRLLARVPIERIGPAVSEDYHPLLALGLEALYEDQ